jgi:flagellar motor switch protein FliN/FliY
MPEEPRQEDIDELMKVLAASAVPPAARPADFAPPPPPPRPAPPPVPPPASTPMMFEPLAPASPGGSRSEAGMDLLGDVNVQVRVELGSSTMNVQDVLKLGSGSVVGLSSLVGDPVNVFVNDRLVARGEVLVVRDNIAVRIIEVVPVPKGGA